MGSSTWPAILPTQAQICRSLGTWTDRLVDLVLLFTCFFAIPLACQRFLHTAFFAGLEIEGMTFDFFNDVFLLDLALKPAQCIFKRLAFLNANLCQKNYTSRRPTLGMDQITGNGRQDSIKATPPGIHGHVRTRRFYKQMRQNKLLGGDGLLGRGVAYLSIGRSALLTFEWRAVYL